MERIKPKKLTSQDDSSYVLSVNLIFIWGFRKWRSRKLHHLPSPLSDRSSSCNFRAPQPVCRKVITSVPRQKTTTTTNLGDKKYRILRWKRKQRGCVKGIYHLPSCQTCTEYVNEKARLRNIHGTGFLKSYDNAPPSAGDFVTADCDVGRRHSSTQQSSGDHDETLDEITWGFDTSPMLSYHPQPDTDHVVKQESLSSGDCVSQRTTRPKKRNLKCDLKRKKVIAKKMTYVDSSVSSRDRRKKEKIVIDKFMSGTTPKHGGSPKKTKKQLKPRVPVGRSVRSQCPQSETTNSKRSSTLQDLPVKKRMNSLAIFPRKPVQKNSILRPTQDPILPRVSISPEKFFLQNKAAHESDLSSESDQGEKAPALQGLTLDSRSEASNVCKRDSWIWFSREAKPSMENFASRQRKFKSEDPRVAELAAEIRRQDEMNRDIEREAESLIESSSQSNKIASTMWTQQPIGPGLQTANRIRARGRVRPSPYARHNTNPAVGRRSREPERKMFPSARKQLSPQKYLVHFLKDNTIDSRKVRSGVKMSLRAADMSFPSSEGDAISHIRAGTPWHPDPMFSKIPSPHTSPHVQSDDPANSPSICPYHSITARKIMTICGRQSPPNDNSILLSSLDSSLTFQPAPSVKVDAQTEERFSRSLSLTPSQEIPPALFNVQNSIGSSPFRNFPHGRRPQSTGSDPRQVYPTTARTQGTFQNQMIQTQGRAKNEKIVHLSTGDSESESLQREISLQDSSLRQVLITKEVNTAIHRLLFDTEQSSSSLSPSSLNKQSAASRGVKPREIGAITYACNQADDVRGQKTCGIKSNVSIQYSVQANPQDSSSCKSDSALRTKQRTNIYNPDYYLGKRVTCKRQLTVGNQTESSSSRWRKKSRPRADTNSPVVFSSEHSNTPLFPKTLADSVIEKTQLLNQRRPEAVKATPIPGPTQLQCTDSRSDVSIGRQDVMPKIKNYEEETTSTGNLFLASRKSSIPISSGCGDDSLLKYKQPSDDYKKQSYEPLTQTDNQTHFLNQQIDSVQGDVPRSNVIKENGTQTSVCFSGNQPRANSLAGHTRKGSRSHEVIQPYNKTPDKVINIGLRSKPLDFSNRPNKSDVISLQDFTTRVNPSKTSNPFSFADVGDVVTLQNALAATDQFQSAAKTNNNIRPSTASDQQAINTKRGSGETVRLKPQKVVTYSDSYWARKIATKQTSSDGPQKSPSLVLGKSESCHLVKASSQKPLRVSSSFDHVSVPVNSTKPAAGVSGIPSQGVTGSTNNSSSNAPYQRIGENKAAPPTMMGQFFFVTTTSTTPDKPPAYPNNAFLKTSNIGNMGDRKELENMSNYNIDLDLVNEHSGDALVSHLTKKPSSPKICLMTMSKIASSSQTREKDIKPISNIMLNNERVFNQQRAEAVDRKNSCSSDDTEPSQMVLPPTSSDDEDDFVAKDIVEKTKTDCRQGESLLQAVVKGDPSKLAAVPTLSNQDSGYEESMSDKAQRTMKTLDDLRGLQATTHTEAAVTDSSSSCSDGSHNSEGFTNVSWTSEECDSETQWTSSRTDNAYVSPRYSATSTNSRLSKFTISKSQRPTGDMSRGCASRSIKSPTHDVQNRLTKINFPLLCDGEHFKYSESLSPDSTSKECHTSVYECEGNSATTSTYLNNGSESVKGNKTNVNKPSAESSGEQEAFGFSQALQLKLSTEMGESSRLRPHCSEDRLSQNTYVSTIPDDSKDLEPPNAWQNYQNLKDIDKNSTSSEPSVTRENIPDASCSTTADVRMLESLLSSELGDPCMDYSLCHGSNTSLDLSTSIGLSTFDETDTRYGNTADTFGDTFVKVMNGTDYVPNVGSRGFEAYHSFDPFTYSVSQTDHRKLEVSPANIILLPPTSSDEDDEFCPKTDNCGWDREKIIARRRAVSSKARPTTDIVDVTAPLMSRDHASGGLLGTTCPKQRADNNYKTGVRRRELIPQRSVNFEELLKRF